MIGIVQTNTNELARLPNAGSKAQVFLRRAHDNGQRVDIQRFQPRDHVWQQGRARDVVHMVRQVTHLPLRIKATRSFVALGTVSQ